MEAKMTVRVSRRLLENAKRYARENNTSLTELISAYLRKLPVEGSGLDHAPIVRRLSGSLSPDVSLDDYKNYLQVKYGGQ